MEYTIYVNPRSLKVYPKLPDSVMEILQDKLSYRMHGYQFTRAFRSYAWDGYTVVFSKNQTAPPGLYKKIKSILEENKLDVKVVFTKDYPQLGDETIYELTPIDFQLESARKVIAEKFGIISAPIRSGKTLIIALIAAKLKQYPIWIITYGKDLVLQTKRELEKFLRIPIGVFSEGDYIPADVMVSSYQAMVRINTNKAYQSEKTRERNEAILKSIQECKALILDECHSIFSQKNKKFLNHFTNIGYLIGASGTPKPDKVSVIELESTIGPIVYKVGFDKLIDSGRITQPIVYMYNLPSDWYQFFLEEYPDIYQVNIVENDFRNKFIAKLVEKLKQSGKTVYIMVSKKKHGKLLSNLIDGSVYVYGNISSDIREQLYKRLNEKSLYCIIATVGKVGLNLPQLDAVINAEGFVSSVATIQKMRSLTSSDTKSVGLVIDFIDHGKYLNDHSKDRMSIYKKLKGFEIQEKIISKDFFGVKNVKE